MRISTLKKLLKKYKKIRQPFFSANVSTAYHELIQNLSNHFKDRNGQEELTTVDIYMVLKLLPFDKHLKLFTAIKAELDQHHLFDIFDILNHAGCMNERCFENIHGCSKDISNAMYHLLKNQDFKISALNKNDIILLLILYDEAIEEKWDLLAIEKCICLLSQWNNLTDISLQMLYQHGSNAHKLVKVFELCNKAFIPSMTINNYNDILPMHTHYSDMLQHYDAICMLLQRLERAGVTVSHHVIDASIYQAMTTFYDSSQLEQFYESLEHFCNIISDKISLDQFDWSALLKLESSSQIIFHNIIHELNTDGLLNQQTFNYYAKKLMSSDSLLHHAHDVVYFVTTLAYDKIFPSNKVLSSLYLLSTAAFDQFKKTVSNLSEAGLLTAKSFGAALERMTARLPPVTALVVQKESKKETKLARTKIKSIDGTYSFFTGPRRRSEENNYGTFKKGYTTEISSTPIINVKKIMESARNKNDDGYHDAVREVKFNRLLNRKAEYFSTSVKTEFFRSHFYHVISEWHTEKDLSQFTTLELMQASSEARLKCLCELLSDLNIIHKHNRIHGDIKSSNVILDLKKLSMKLIDFGGAIKFGSGKDPVTTFLYSDPYGSPAHFYSDVYLMGTVIMTLFPELYQDETNISISSHIIFAPTTKTNLSLIEKAMKQLVDAMQSSNINERCTSDDAYQYCVDVLKNLQQLDDKMLQNITLSTIKRSNTTVEDILRETRLKSV